MLKHEHEKSEDGQMLRRAPSKIIQNRVQTVKNKDLEHTHKKRNATAHIPDYEQSKKGRSETGTN
jgi:hypothetical protein